MCGCKPNQCFITLSIVTSGPQVNLPESMRLRNNRVTSMWVRRLGEETATNPITGQDLAPDTVVLSSYLTLKNQNGTAIDDPIPMQMLMRDYNAPEPLRVDYQQIDPVQSVINIDISAAGYDATDIIEITFGIDCSACGTDLK